MSETDIRGSMDRAAVDAFLAQAVIARIATVRGEAPQVVPMWFDWDGKDLWMETGRGFQKHKNLLANPRCAVAIDVSDGGLRFKGVILEGEAELIESPDEFVRDIVLRIYRKYLGEEGLSAPTPRAMIDSPHVIIRLHPVLIRTWDDTATGLAPLT